MKTYEKRSLLLLFAIIILGGIGIIRTIAIKPDPIGLIAIVGALLLAWLYMRMSVVPVAGGGFGYGTSKSQWPINLAFVASDQFEFFPGRAEGYAGYTDYTAMSVDVNDDLAARPPADQYALTGFGNGFLEGLFSRISEIDSNNRLQFCASDTIDKNREMIGWLAFLQASGIDNAGPSTENLQSVLQSVATKLRTGGPITTPYWSSAAAGQNEDSAADGVDAEMLKAWVGIYDEQLLVGLRLSSEGALIEIAD